MSRDTWIIGIDEVGRGPLAGPVYIGIFAHKKKKRTTFLRGIKDSKKISEKKRNEWFTTLQKRTDVRCITVSRGPSVIDKRGILWALNDAIRSGLKKLAIEPRSCEIYLDGGLVAPLQYKRQKTIIKGDEKIAVISAASIIAKVTRDKKMLSLSKQYPQYNFSQHKGYGTELHRKAIRKSGLSVIHRKSYCKNIISENV